LKVGKGLNYFRSNLHHFFWDNGSEDILWDNGPENGFSSWIVGPMISMFSVIMSLVIVVVSQLSCTCDRLVLFQQDINLLFLFDFCWFIIILRRHVQEKRGRERTVTAPSLVISEAESHAGG